MNVDAEIVLSSADGVLAIPSLAVNRGDTVLVTSDSPSAPMLWSRRLRRDTPMCR